MSPVGVLCKLCEGAHHTWECEDYEGHEVTQDVADATVEQPVQPGLWPPSNASTRPDRLKFSVHERVFLRRWQQECEQRTGTAATFLELLLSTEKEARAGYCAVVTDRDSRVAASVIQWLGTNCGHCFLENCRKEIDALRPVEQRLEMRSHMHRWNREDEGMPEGHEATAVMLEEAIASGAHDAGKLLRAALRETYEVGRAMDWAGQLRAAYERGRTDLRADEATLRAEFERGRQALRESRAARIPGGERAICLQEF